MSFSKTLFLFNFLCRCMSAVVQLGVHVLAVIEYSSSCPFSFFYDAGRSGRSDAHQALDAVVEEMNANLKSWIVGERSSDKWRQIVRNYDKLVELRQKASDLF